jgi:hypothetical protein
MKKTAHRQLCRWAIAASVLACMLAQANDAVAWGYEGHYVIAEIADKYLGPSASRQVHALLAIDNASTLAEVSTWADEIRSQRPDTASWHFVNIPIDPPAGTMASYDPGRDCARGNCIVEKLREFAAELGDDTLPPRRRLEALKFIVHFVADIHQPLHCSDHHDRGGNTVQVEFMGYPTNLHAVWDTALIVNSGFTDERSYAMDLAHHVTPEQVSEWSSIDIENWANESYHIARDVIYPDLPHRAGQLDNDYERFALPIVSQQLAKAGIRLAALLTMVLK